MARGKRSRQACLRLLHASWTKAAGAAAGLVLWAGSQSLSGPVHAQTPEHVETVQYHLNKQTIKLPIQLDQQFRPILQEIRLYVKDNLSAPWTLRDKAPPTQAEFTFKAPHDGEYWFMMVTVDREGRCAPSDISKEPPAMAVVVDTQAPQAEVALVGTGKEGQLIQCNVHDAHLDPTRTRVQYQTVDKTYRDLERLPDRINVFCIPAQANITGQIRVCGADQAGNVLTRDWTLGQLATVGKAPVVAQQQAKPAAPVTPAAPAAPVTPAAPAVAVAPSVTPVSTEPPLVGPQLQLPPAASVQANASPAVTMPRAEKVAPKLLPEGLTASPALVSATANVATIPQGPPLAADPVPTVPEAPIARTSGSEPTVSVAAPPSGPKLDPMAAPPVMTAPVAAPPVATAPVAAPPVVTAPVVPDTKTVPSTPPVMQAPTLAAKRDGMPVHLLLVNSKRVFLEYRIEQSGPSGVGRVEVWCTRDKGQTWQRIAEDRDRKSPAEVQLPGDGVFGLTLVVSNGLGFGAQPPAPGDTPDWWIEVDATQPVAQINSVRLSTDDGPAVHIGWSSKDRNLGTGPADLFYAIKRSGPWLPIAKGLRGEGQHRWVPPADIGSQAFFRLTVRDLAGNTTITETTQPVALDDLSRPRAIINGITTDTGATPAVKTDR